jgi:hypothetical protein
MPADPPAAWELALLALTVLVGAGVVVGTLRTGAPPMPTRPLVRDAMLRHIPPDARVIHELGCGFGGLALAAARARPDAEVHAWERAVLPWWVARIRAALFGRGRVHVHRGDLLAAPHARADAVLLYLHPDAMAVLAPRLSGGLRPGTTVVSNSFALPGWTPAAEDRLPDALRTKVLVYRAPPPPPAG